MHLQHHNIDVVKAKNKSNLPSVETDKDLSRHIKVNWPNKKQQQTCPCPYLYNASISIVPQNVQKHIGSASFMVSFNPSQQQN